MFDGIGDLSREVYCLFGIPVDNIGMREAVDQIDQAVRNKTSFLVATPNVNFLVNATLDDAFRESIVSSDLCIPDGMWLVRLGRMVGIPIKERVAGADILDALKSKRSNADPVKLFIFGGTDAAGQRAREAINARADGLHCMGSANPGYGSLEQMSADDAIRDVNSSQADFLLVALGAVKGQMWLHHNHERLNVPVRAHLGAAINFYAGSVKRAPRRLQKWGFEWAWRIKEEPLLWRRYAHDGAFIAAMFLTRVAPLLLWTVYLRLRSRFVGERLELYQKSRPGRRVISLGGALTAGNVELIASAVGAAICANEDLVVDLAGARAVDARFAGLLLMLQKTLARRGRKAHFAGASPVIRWLVGLYGFEIPVSAPEPDGIPAAGIGFAAAE